jgi:hypothetical protein
MCCCVSCSDFIYLLNVTVAGIYNTGYPGTAMALKVSVKSAHVLNTLLMSCCSAR